MLADVTIVNLLDATEQHIKIVMPEDNEVVPFVVSVIPVDPDFQVSV